MDAIELLRNRIGSVAALTSGLIERAREIDHVRPVLPGTSPIGLTLWHIPRTQDWLVHTTVRAEPEIADSLRDGLPDPNVYGYGVALSTEEAARAASEVRLDALLGYVNAVATAVDGWLASCSETDLDAIPPLLERQRSREAYAKPGSIDEIGGLDGLPVGVLVLRPCISHALWHIGEVDLLLQLAPTNG